MQKLPGYKTFSYKNSIVSDGRILLADEPLSLDVREKITKLETTDQKEVIFLQDLQLATELEASLSQVVKQEEDILFVFPGNGSNYPRRLSRICQNFPTTASVYAERYWVPGNDPTVMAGKILPEMFLVTQIQTIVVIDDVVSSGLTMKKLYQNNAWRFPRARWIGMSWISQFPKTKADSGITGYFRTETACVVRKKGEGRVPINSISTLRQNKEIAESYASRHFKEPRKFLHLISR